MVYKLNPIFKDKIWGGDYLKKTYNYQSTTNTGEAWGISGYKGSSSIILNGPYQGNTLYELYKSHKHLFGNYPSDNFPILVKIIEAKDDLSIQVHPNDIYAKQFNSLGKTECWYIIDCKEDSQIIIGHNALTKEELLTKINNKEYNSLLNKFNINKGDFFKIPAGMIHAICKDTVLLEVQQSSDITYRLYDYDRLDNGKPRDLHIKESLDVIQVPSIPIENTGNTKYFDFTVKTINNLEKISHKYGDYYFIIEGTAQSNGLTLNQGDFIFIPSNTSYKIIGNIKVGFINIK